MQTYKKFANNYKYSNMQSTNSIVYAFITFEPTMIKILPQEFKNIFDENLPALTTVSELVKEWIKTIVHQAAKAGAEAVY